MPTVLLSRAMAFKDTPASQVTPSLPRRTFCYPLTVRFYEIDRAGIVFFGRFYEYCHAAEEELLAAMFGHPEAIFTEIGFGMPLVHSEADYKRPCRLGDRLEIRISVARLGTASVTLRFEVHGPQAQDTAPQDTAPQDTAPQDDLRAVVHLVHAFVDMEHFTPMRVPARYRDALQTIGLLPPPVAG